MADYAAGAGEGAPGVVVLHDWYGLLPHVRVLCDDLAAAGFSAVAVDLYDGAATTAESQAQSLMDGLTMAVARETIAAAVRGLRRSGVMAPRVAVVGFSMGGSIALRLAQQGLFDAAVAYYATGSPADVPLPCPVQLHLAEVDDFEPADLPQRYVDAVRRAGGSAVAHTYPGTVHSFANADSVAYHHAEATRQAFQRTLTFLGGG